MEPVNQRFEVPAGSVVVPLAWFQKLLEVYYGHGHREPTMPLAEWRGPHPGSPAPAPPPGAPLGQEVVQQRFDWEGTEAPTVGARVAAVKGAVPRGAAARKKQGGRRGD